MLRINFPAFFAFKNRLDALAFVDFDAQSFDTVEKAIDDRLRGIGYGKYTAVFLDLECDAVFFKPFNCVTRSKLVEWPTQFLFAAWVKLREFIRDETGVRHIAASAA